MRKRRRFRQMISLKDRLAAFAKEAREKAAAMPPGNQRDDMLKRARRADNAAHVDNWVNSSGLRPPR